MLEILQTSSIAGFVAGICFVLGNGLCWFLLTRIIPEKFIHPVGPQQSDADSRRTNAFRQLALQYFDRKQQKVYVRVANPTQELFENLLFRLTARNAQGELVEETISVANCSFGNDSTTDCLLTIHDDEERQNIFDPTNDLKVELVRSYNL